MSAPAAKQTEERSLISGQRREDAFMRGLSDVGVVRKANQDYWGYLEPGDGTILASRGKLACVCDGMGGHAGGEVASLLAVETILDQYGQFDPDEDVVTALARAVTSANEVIHSTATNDATLKGMGSTVTALVIQGETAYLAQVGDSRGYLVRGVHIQRLTKDHSLVQQLVDEGLIDESEMETHPDKNVILRSLGVRPSVKVDICSIPTRPGDVFLLCSDGLSGLLGEDELHAIVSSHDGLLDEACQVLVDMANSLGGHDNITVQLLQTGPRPSNAVPDETIPPVSYAEGHTPTPPKQRAQPIKARSPKPPTQDGFLGSSFDLPPLALVLLVAICLILAVGSAVLGLVAGMQLATGKALKARDAAHAASASVNERLRLMDADSLPDEVRKQLTEAETSLSAADADFGGLNHLSTTSKNATAENTYAEVGRHLDELIAQQHAKRERITTQLSDLAAVSLPEMARLTAAWRARAVTALGWLNAPTEGYETSYANLARESHNKGLESMAAALASDPVTPRSLEHHVTAVEDFQFTVIYSALAHQSELSHRMATASGAHAALGMPRLTGAANAVEHFLAVHRVVSALDGPGKTDLATQALQALERLAVDTLSPSTPAGTDGQTGSPR